MNFIEKIREDIEKIPLLSTSAAKLLNTLSKKDFEKSEVLKIVQEDHVLTGKILRIVNSAAFSFTREIKTVKEAIAFLGKNHLTTIALESIGSDIFSGDMSAYKTRQGMLWNHSLRTAAASREISNFSKKKISGGTAFTAGILHDIGKSLLSSFLMMNNGADVISEYIQVNPSANFITVERSRTGTDHCEVGALLAEHWRLPKIFHSVILHHHSPSESDEKFREYAFSVHIGDMISMMMGSGTGIDSFHYPLDENFSKYFELTEIDIQKVILSVEDEFEHLMH